jgi:K+-sensing histidine kinase KdpD
MGETSPQEIEEFMKIIHSDGLRILRLLEKMILLIDVEGHNAIFDPKPASVEEAFRSAAESTHLFTADRSINMDIPNNAMAMADARKLHTVAVEVLENTIIHGTPDAPVSVTLKTEGKNLVITVANSLSEGHRADPKKVFGKFVQGNEGDLTAKPPGLGVGLTLCRAICQAMRGKISCERPSKTKWITKISLPRA